MTTFDEAATWHVLTCEHPPEVGGLASYCGRVVQELAGRGQRVHVWTRGDAGGTSDGVTVHAAADRWSVADLRRVSRELDALPGPKRLFVHWVPHGYGYKSLNLPFAIWVALRAAGGDRLEVLVHEPWLEFSWRRPRQSVAALVHRMMMRLVLGGASRAWVSIQAWQAMVQRYAPHTAVKWLPVPSLIPVIADTHAVEQTRAALAPPDRPVVGHFGTYGPHITTQLGPALETVLDHNPQVTVVLLGRDSNRYLLSFVGQRPDLAGRVVATGTLTDRALSLHVQACDVMLQPYPDGVSSRRSSATSLLAHGCAIATTSGRLTEPLWHESGALELAALTPVDLSAAVLRLLDDEARRAALERAARDLHQRVFAIEKTVDTLLERGTEIVAA